MLWQKPQMGELLSYKGASTLRAIPPIPYEDRQPVEYEPFASDEEALDFTTRALKAALDEEG